VDHLDRLLSLAPLALVGFALHRNERERAKLLELLDRDRTAFRDERRELINRVQAPHLIPQGTRPVDRRPEPSPAAAASAQARAAYNGVGRAAAPAYTPAPANGTAPGDGDDMP
jgi:hypothetical protein